MKKSILQLKGLALLSALLLSATPILCQHIDWNAAPQTGFVFQITNQEAEKLLTRSSADTIINALLHTQIDTFRVSKGWTDRPEKGHFILAKIIEKK